MTSRHAVKIDGSQAVRPRNTYYGASRAIGTVLIPRIQLHSCPYDSTLTDHVDYTQFCKASDVRLPELEVLAERRYL